MAIFCCNALGLLIKYDKYETMRKLLCSALVTRLRRFPAFLLFPAFPGFHSLRPQLSLSQLIKLQLVLQLLDFVAMLIPCPKCLQLLVSSWLKIIDINIPENLSQIYTKASCLSKSFNSTIFCFLKLIRSKIPMCNLIFCFIFRLANTSNTQFLIFWLIAAENSVAFAGCLEGGID